MTSQSIALYIGQGIQICCWSTYDPTPLVGLFPLWYGTLVLEVIMSLAVISIVTVTESYHL